jgi:hypothetical protein
MMPTGRGRYGGWGLSLTAHWSVGVHHHHPLSHRHQVRSKKVGLGGVREHAERCGKSAVADTLGKTRVANRREIKYTPL